MRIPVAVAATMLALAANAQDAKGRIVVAVGVCNQSIAELPVLWFRKVDQSAHFSARGASFGNWDYSDDTGRFDVHMPMLAAGEWEMFRYEMVVPEMARKIRYRPRNDYSHKFTVAPGSVVDLGRYCAATQTTGEKYPDSDRVWNQIARLSYLHVSANREVDVEKARKPEGGGDPFELVSARPDPPERVSPLLRGRFVEPRVIPIPKQRNPTAPSVNPVN